MSLIGLAAAAASDCFRTRSGLILENLALRQQLAVLRRKHPQRIVPAPTERAFWIVLAGLWRGWRSLVVFVRPDTIVRWHRAGFRWFWRWKSRRRGRPRIEAALRQLIRKMALENPVWGAPRIHGELLKLGFEVSQRSVSRWLPPRRGRAPRGGDWSTFVRNHLADLIAVDFFAITTATFRVIYGFAVISLGRRELLHTAVTARPTAEWASDQLAKAASGTRARRLIRDRDPIYGGAFSDRALALGISELITAPRMPQQNAYAERVIGSIRRECLNQVVVLNERHGERLLADYAEYYNETRTHLSLEKDAPQSRPVSGPAQGQVFAQRKYLGGLHHRYSRRAA